MAVILTLDHQLIIGDKFNPLAEHGKKIQIFVIKTAQQRCLSGDQDTLYGECLKNDANETIIISIRYNTSGFFR